MGNRCHIVAFSSAFCWEFDITCVERGFLGVDVL